ncbi:hypothetical protein HHL17_14940 [Chitinophaga sp. G-6-1-13]|uniref:Uncharacterized protein n=1 Tax=Chitinophaga fulva TaxID=2728842 RepID=A0A848GNZ6_9BACT|nr:hypothetical protein [Chitinophaga fulva]NML38503.1 hypothetical protein [Chitinophaga fulva]
MKDKLEELRAQQESRKYLLKVLEDENICFKLKLARILSTDFDRRELGRLEYFQSRFLKMDEQIALLRHEISEQQGVLASVQTMTGLKDATVSELMMERRFTMVQQHFDMLDADFRHYLRQSFPLV